MLNTDFDNYRNRLNLARNGGGILFCGAGYSADCLSFTEDKTLGTGGQLLAVINEKLGLATPFKDLRNAAEKLHEQIADHGMMGLLKKQFQVSEVTQDMVDIMRFPWDTVYTTNYDNAIEIAARAANRTHQGLNNTEDPQENRTGMPIVHLHGFVNGWNIQNFRDSCVLTGDSYMRLTRVKAWLKRFRDDIDRAEFVAFVGFSADDFHINNVIYNSTGLQQKAVFVNRPAAEVDPDVDANQKRLGTPFYFGRDGFSRDITTVLKTSKPKEPRLASFRRFEQPTPAPSVPQADDIEELFIFGKTIPEQLARDVTDGVSDYHLARKVIGQVLEHISNGARIILLTGVTCDGKTLVLNDLLLKIAAERPVYNLLQHYETLLNEVASILKYSPNATLAIENCFDMSSERLASIATQFDGQNRILLLTGRSISTEASSAVLVTLKKLDSFRHVPIPNLDEGEADALADLVDRFAGWRKFWAGHQTARRDYILKSCKGSLPHFLLKMLDSKYVRERYQEEFSKISLDSIEREVVILALYSAHIGEGVPVSFLSNLLEVDAGAVIDQLNEKSGNSGFQLVRRRGDRLETVPSIGARNILHHLFSDKEVVDTIVATIGQLAQTYPRNDFETTMFKQMMRYSILSRVVTDRGEINRFFDHNTQLSPIRRMPLFWLQWHMAKTAEGEYLTAEKYLEQGYKEADDYDRRTGNTWNRKQLDDRRAKFLMIRAINTSREGTDLFRDFQEAMQLTGKLFQDQDLNHYPYETLEALTTALEAKRSLLGSPQRTLVFQGLTGLHKKAETRAGIVAEGHQKKVAERALSNISSIVARIKSSE